MDMTQFQGEMTSVSHTVTDETLLSRLAGIRGGHATAAAPSPPVRTEAEAALAELIDRHDRWLRGVVYAVLGSGDEVDDVLQHVWHTVWRKRSDLGDVANARHWLYRVGRRAAIDAWRSRKRRRRLGQSDEFADRADPAPPADAQAHWKEQLARTVRVVNGLPEKYRTVLALRAWGQLSYAEIARVLGLRVATVETRLVRARRLLRDRIGPMDA